MKYIELHNNTIYGYSDIVERPFTVFNSDSESLFEDNLKTAPKDWIYRDKQISYKRNQFGHRSKDISNLADEFILITGCSLAEGIGLAEEDTFPHLIAKELGLDYYNLAVASSGPDLIYKNLSLWFDNIKRKPSMIIIQHTFPDRAFIPKNGGILPLGPWFDRIPKGMLERNETDAFENLIVSEFAEHYFHIMRSQFNTMCKSLAIPVYEIAPPRLSLDGVVAQIETKDFARDLKHPGIESHRAVASQVVRAIVANSKS